MQAANPTCAEAGAGVSADEATKAPASDTARVLSIIVPSLSI